MTPTTTLTAAESRFAQALGALVRAGERAERAHLGGLYLGDLYRSSSLGSAEALGMLRQRLLSEWRRPLSPLQRETLADLAEQAADQAGRLGRTAATRRNAWVWSPGAIADEIAETDGAVTALGRDIFSQYCRPFEAAYERAERALAAQLGRPPATGAISAAQSDAERAQLLRAVGIEPGSVEDEERCFQGQLVKQWRAFTREWDDFKANHATWHQRMFSRTAEQAISYRERVLAWRTRFAVTGRAM